MPPTTAISSNDGRRPLAQPSVRAAARPVDAGYKCCWKREVRCRSHSGDVKHHDLKAPDSGEAARNDGEPHIYGPATIKFVPRRGAIAMGARVVRQRKHGTKLSFCSRQCMRAMQPAGGMAAPSRLPVRYQCTSSLAVRARRVGSELIMPPIPGVAARDPRPRRVRDRGRWRPTAVECPDTTYLGEVPDLLGRVRANVTVPTTARRLTAAFGVASLGHASARHGDIAAQSTRLVHAMGDVHPNALKVQV
jgi:hypothetical protein